MEFDEMKKIWDSQNEEPLYAINEAALHRSIKSQKERAGRLNNIGDFSLIAACIAVAIIYSIRFIVNGTPTIYDSLIVIAMLLYSGYVWYSRTRRKKREQTFGHTILGDLNHAISGVKYRAWRTKSLVWRFLVPIYGLYFLDMSQTGASLWDWIGTAAVLVLAALASRWQYNQCNIPRLQELEALREKLTEEAEVPSL
jgi:Ca2+/Na+ antiporter